MCIDDQEPAFRKVAANGDEGIQFMLNAKRIVVVPLHGPDGEPRLREADASVQAPPPGFGPRLDHADRPGAAAAMSKLVRGLRKFGPFVTVAIFVPGGMVLAPLMWIAQRRRKAA